MSECFIVNVQRDKLVHSNRNSHKWRRDELKKIVDQQVGWRAKTLSRAGRARIWVGVIKGNRNVYDPANLTDSMKPVVDALVRAKVVDDDNFKFVQGPWLFHLGYDKRLRDVVEFIVCVSPWGTSQEEAKNLMRGFVISD